MRANLVEVDAAVGSVDLAADLQRLLPGVEVHVRHLVQGDIRFRGRGPRGRPVSVGIEYKKLPELLTSIRTERLQGFQLPRMLQRYDYTWLVVEGVPREDGLGHVLGTYSSIPVNEFEKRMLSLMVPARQKYRHPFLHYALGRVSALRFLQALYRWWTDVDLDEHKSHIAYYDPPPFLEVSLFRQRAMKLPGVGMEMSKRLEQHFAGNELAMLAAGEDAWAAIEGIGGKRAEALARTCRKLRGL